MPYPWADMVLYFFIYSFCGWLMETVLCSVEDHRFVNRGFLNGPLCPIYGVGVLLMLIFLIPVKESLPDLTRSVPVVFFSGLVLASAVEYFTSWIMEKLFHARWWDYSNKKYNLNGRICLSISLAWGGLATGFLFFVQPEFEKLTALLYGVNPALPGWLAGALMAGFAADTWVSFVVAKRIGNKLEQMDKWGEMIRGYAESLSLPTREELERKLEDLSAHVRLPALPAEWKSLSTESLRQRLGEHVEELRERSRQLMEATRWHQSRMLRAFPGMKWPGNGSLQALREYLTARAQGRSVSAPSAVLPDKQPEEVPAAPAGDSAGREE